LEIKETEVSNLSKNAWEILNATADDCENLEQIYHQIHEHLVTPDLPSERGVGHSQIAAETPLLAEIADNIRELVEHGLLEVVVNGDGNRQPNVNDLSFVWRAWFRMTSQGREAWERSAYGLEQDHV
jgi:hypothetical protein